MRLEQFGWNSFFSRAFEAARGPGQEPGRVRLARPQSCVLMTADGELEVSVAGRLQLDGQASGPVAGDWVVFSRPNLRLEAVLPRATEIARRRPGPRPEPQVLAANLDVLLVVSAFGRDFNLRRMERYLLLAQQSGAKPVLVLNKLDECEDPAEALRQVRPVAQGAPVVLMNALSGIGFDELCGWIAPGQTAALLGSSGVGKSTIVNRLLGEERQRVNELGAANRRGQHTTTERELFVLPGGQLFLDTPGLRELQPWVAADGLGAAFAEIQKLAESCRFRDCRHQGEPGCAVRAAASEGEIDPGRVDSYHRLQRELEHGERQIDALAALEEKQRLRRMFRHIRRTVVHKRT